MQTDHHSVRNLDLHEPLSQLAHEMRTPLNALGFSIQLLRAQAGVGMRTETLDIMDRQLELLKRLADDLFQAAQAQASAAPRQLCLVDLNEVTLHAIEACEPSLRARQHTLTLSFTPMLPLIEGDRIQLRQVIVNLLDNACKYTPPNGTISLATTLEDGFAVMRVSDNGCGIAQAELPHVFQAFRRATESVAAGDGLGMGLALVKKWVGAHQGSVDVSSAGPGHGSTFTVRLPLRRRRSRALSQTARDTPRASQGPADAREEVGHAS